MGEQEIIERLMALFEAMGERGGVVCWRDATGEFSELVCGLELADVVVLREVPGGLFALKRQVNEALPGSRILLYRAGEQAASVDWLQDVDVLAVPFSADRASGLLSELGADDTPQMREALDVCGKYLARRGAIGRVAALRTGFGEAAELVLAVMAAALGARSCEVPEVVAAWLKGGDAARKKFRTAGLEDAFAALALDEVVANPLYGLDDDFRGAADFIEGLYKEWFLRGQNIRWCNAIEDDLANKGEVKGLPRQVDFFPAEVEGSASRCRRAWVIVSDALRYEVAAELVQNLERSTKGTAELTGVQGALPTKTKVGMPALLPHGVFETVCGPKGGFTVHVDGAEAASTDARQNALRCFSAGAVAVRFDDFLHKSDRGGRKQLVADAEVVYIYHNAIDALGDDPLTERKVFQACGDAVEEISSLVKLLVKEFRAAEVLITADHGFLYTAKPLDESEHAAAADVAGKVVETSRRYVVTRPGAESSVLLRAKLPGKEGLEAFFPRECVRLADARGGGELRPRRHQPAGDVRAGGPLL